jgi:general secretion pathway protein D
MRDDKVLTGATAEKYRTIRQDQLEQRDNRGLLVKKSEIPVLPEWEAVIRKAQEDQAAAKNANNAKPAATEE